MFSLLLPCLKRIIGRRYVVQLLPVNPVSWKTDSLRFISPLFFIVFLFCVSLGSQTQTNLSVWSHCFYCVLSFVHWRGRQRQILHTLCDYKKFKGWTSAAALRCLCSFTWMLSHTVMLNKKPTIYNISNTHRSVPCALTHPKASHRNRLRELHSHVCTHVVIKLCTDSHSQPMHPTTHISQAL